MSIPQDLGHLDIVIPATTEVVGRGPGLAAYLNGRDELPVLALARRTSIEIILEEAHDLEVGDQIFVDGVLPTGEVGDIEAGTPSGNFASPDDNQSGTTNAAAQSTNSQTGTYEGAYGKAIRDDNGRLIILGGATLPGPTPLDNVTALEVVSDAHTSSSPNWGRLVTYKWTQVSNDGTHGFSGNNFEFRSFGASKLEDGRILCTGGADGDDATGTPSNGWDMLRFLPPDSVSQQSGTLPAARASHAQASIEGGDALVCGGWTVANTPLATTMRFDIASQTWDDTLADMNQARMRHALVALDDGFHFLAIGGKTNAAGTAVLARCEIYEADSAEGTWVFTGNMTYARYDFGVIKIPDGRVIVFGGMGYKETRTHSPGALDSVEIYDPNTGLWSMLRPMKNAHVNPAIAYNEDENCIYVCGGMNAAFDVEILDLDTMKWRFSQARILTPHLDVTGGIVGDDVFAVIGGADHGISTEKTNQLIVPGVDHIWLGAGINGMHRVVEVPAADSIVVENDEYDFGNTYNVARAGAGVTPMGAEAAPAGIPGPFSYDVKTGLAITAVNATTDQEFNEGGNYASIHLDTSINPTPALDFPDEEGFIVLQFGYKNQVGPIRYLGRLSDEDLILDAGSVWQASLPAGATVRLLSSRLPFAPESDALVGNFYATGTAAGRVAAQKLIDEIVAAGKQVLVTVLYPGDAGLGAEGYPQSGNYKLSDKVMVWGGDDLDQEIPKARRG